MRHFIPPVLPRTFRQLSVKACGKSLPEGFIFSPEFFDSREQRLLLTAALSRLDATEGKRVRKLQTHYRAQNPVSDKTPVEGLFLPDGYYTFYEGHYDNVIRDYREMHLASWPESELRRLTPILDRLRALCPSENTQTHLLHLASSGEILPHIDNTSTSGKWILGVSLGSARILRMESPDSREPESFDILLPSGSVYLQRDDIRYHWKHAILPSVGMQKAECKQRVSIMIRDCRGDDAEKAEVPHKHEPSVAEEVKCSYPMKPKLRGKNPTTSQF